MNLRRITLSVLLCLASISVAQGKDKENKINIQIIQDATNATITTGDSTISLGEQKGLSIPPQGITGVHYIDQKRGKESVYFRNDLAILNNDDEETVTFLYHQDGDAEDQLTKFIVRRQDLIHLTYRDYAVVFKEGWPDSRTGLWEIKADPQWGWVAFGATLIGIGVYEGLQWKKLNPAKVREVPVGVVLRPDYFSYDTHRWQEKDLAKQEKRIRWWGVESGISLVVGSVSIILGLETHSQVLLGNGVTLPFSLQIRPTPTGAVLAFSF